MISVVEYGPNQWIVEKYGASNSVRITKRWEYNIRTGRDEAFYIEVNGREVKPTDGRLFFDHFHEAKSVAERIVTGY